MLLKSVNKLLTVLLLLAGCGEHIDRSSVTIADDDGVRDGNSGGLQGSSNSVWFLGDTPVEYCIKSSNVFAATKHELSGFVKDVIASWQDFLRRYSLSERTVGDFVRGDRTRKMSRTFIERPDCDKPKEQITFLFDMSNSFLEQNRIQIENSLGTALRYPYNTQSYRTGGVVWIRDFTDQPLKIKHLLLHEFGHILGMTHDSVHVMHKDVATLLVDSGRVADDDLIKSHLGQIESGAWHFGLFKSGKKINLSSGFICEGARNWKAIESLPNFMRQKLTEGDTCYRIQLGFDRYLDLYQINLNFSLETRSGKKIDFSGSFQSSGNLVESIAGPSVYGAFSQMGTTTPQMGQRFFAKLAQEPWLNLKKELMGFIDVNGVHYAASITNHHGFQLRVFDPQSGQWFKENERLYEDYIWEN